MPNYQYVCKKCDYWYNEIRSINEDHKTTLCPTCGDELKQAYSPPMISLKGPGFYKNSRKK